MKNGTLFQVKKLISCVLLIAWLSFLLIIVDNPTIATILTALAGFFVGIGYQQTNPNHQQ